MARVALDTNILLYVEGLRVVDADDRKIARALALLDELYVDGIEICLAAQVLCELHNGLRRKLRIAPQEASERVRRLTQFCRTAPTDEDVIRTACDIADAHGLQTYDAVILAAAASAGCEALYSEDMQHGFEWGGVMVVNPFT